MKTLAWPALAIVKPSHNITTRIYFADKALHQGFRKGYLACFFHTCRVMSPSLVRRRKNKLWWWITCNTSHTYQLTFFCATKYFLKPPMEGIIRELTATQRRRRCFWQAIYTQMFPHPIPNRNKRDKLTKKQQQEKNPNQTKTTTPPHHQNCC